MTLTTKEAVIILGHGSRVPGAARGMEQVAEGLRQRHGHNVVEVCNMSRLGPHFPETFQKCAEQGAVRVVVIPYFLHDGLHQVLDIPRMIQETAAKYPHIQVILGGNLGFDSLLVDLVEKRVREAGALCDVRELTLESAEKYPAPPGQCEFVPMSPTEAEKYRNRPKDHS